MKKKIFAAVTAAAVGLLSLPLISGCNAIDNYILKVDDDGNKYYVAGYRGFTSSLKGEYEIPEYYCEGDDRARKRDSRARLRLDQPHENNRAQDGHKDRHGGVRL